MYFMYFLNKYVTITLFSYFKCVEFDYTRCHQQATTMSSPRARILSNLDKEVALLMPIGMLTSLSPRSEAKYKQPCIFVEKAVLLHFRIKIIYLIVVVVRTVKLMFPLPPARTKSFLLVRTTTLGKSVYPDIALHISNYYMNVAFLKLSIHISAMDYFISLLILIHLSITNIHSVQMKKSP